MEQTNLPMSDRKYLASKQYLYREVNDGAQKGLIVDHFKLPEGKFDLEESSLLIILPAGYPDVPPDMFYFLPEIRLKATNAYALQTEYKETHFQEMWQRWSRHAPAENWRAGKDGIQSYIQRVITALNIAV